MGAICHWHQSITKVHHGTASTFTAVSGGCFSMFAFDKAKQDCDHWSRVRLKRNAEREREEPLGKAANEIFSLVFSQTQYTGVSV